MLSKKEQERRLNLVGGWDESGLSQGEYRSKTGMTIGVFNYWLKKYRALSLEAAEGEEEEEEGKGSFVELLDPDQQKVQRRYCEIQFPNGLELKLNPSDLGELIKLLKDA